MTEHENERTPVDGAEEHPDFPSGEWIGYWIEGGSRCRQDLVLRFRGGALSGSGGDGVGAFTIHGQYDVESREVTWTKRYLGSHDVYYRGFREIKGIWGTWEIDSWRSGFHIWPRSEGDGEAIAISEEIEVPSEAELLEVGPSRSEQGQRTQH